MTELSPQAIIDKIVTARTRLILDKPFLGALVLRLPLQAADPSWCATTGTDARKFYYNPTYITELRPDEMQFVLAHEALHCALAHFARRQQRVKRRWDLACDYAINPILVADGLKPPPGVMLLKQFAGMSAEEIYPCIADNDWSETLDQHLYDKDDQPNEGGQDQQSNPLEQRAEGKQNKAQTTSNDNKAANEPNVATHTDANNAPQADSADAAPPETEPNKAGNEAAPPPLSQAEAEELAIQWQQRLAGAAQQAEQAGKLSGIMQRLVQDLLRPRLPWRSLLAHYLTGLARDDYSYTRPSNRRGHPAIFPSLKSQQVHAVVAVDVSGSIRAQELQAYLSEINAIKAQIRAEITLLACDAEIVAGFPRHFPVWEEVVLPEAVAGGGTTDFRPVFDWIERQDQLPNIVVYFTDAAGIFPRTEPHYPVLWLVKGRADVPWGIRVQLN